MSRRSSVLMLVLPVLLVACGQPDIPASGGDPPTQPAQVAVATRETAASPLPNVPVHPGAISFSLEQLPAAYAGLEGRTTSPTVQVAIIHSSSTAEQSIADVLAFYRQALPAAGWSLIHNYPNGVFFHRPAADGSTTGLYITAGGQGVGKQGLIVELIQFTSAEELAPFSHSYQPSQTWTDFAGDVAEAEGLAVAPDGSVYVTDPRNQQVLKVDQQGQIIDVWEDYGSGPGQFGGSFGSDDQIEGHGPTGVMVDADGQVYVVDAPNGRVQQFSADGTFLSTWGSLGEGPGQFSSSMLSGAKGIARNADGEIFVTDSDSNRVQKFSSDGRYLLEWTIEHPDDEYSFARPEWIAVDAAGDVYITDSFNNRVKKYRADGTFLLAWGSEGLSPGRLRSPAGIAVAPDGSIVVVDSMPESSRIQIFDSQGRLLGLWDEERALPDTTSSQMYVPEGIAIDGTGRLYVGDQGQAEVEVFTPIAFTAPGLEAVSQPAADPTAGPGSALQRLPSAAEWETFATDWMHGNPCAAPCWEGITPGVTTVGEAMELLREHPMIDPDSVTIHSPKNVRGTHGFDGSIYPDVLVWRWIGMPVSGHDVGGVILYDRSSIPGHYLSQLMLYGEPVEATPEALGQIVSIVTPYFSEYSATPYASERYWEYATIGDVIDALGEPSHVVALEGGADWYTLNVVFEEHGVVLMSLGRSAPTLDQEWSPSKILMSDRPIDDALVGQPQTALTPWQGLREFDFYCRSEETGAPCQ